MYNKNLVNFINEHKTQLFRKHSQKMTKYSWFIYLLIKKESLNLIRIPNGNDDRRVNNKGNEMIIGSSLQIIQDIIIILWQTF